MKPAKATVAIVNIQHLAAAMGIIVPGSHHFSVSGRKVVRPVGKNHVLLCSFRRSIDAAAQWEFDPV